jgi:cytoskeletal protein RodZ
MKLEGEIGELQLIDRLVELGRDRFTGAVRFENDGIIKIIYFKAGDILSASTNDRADSVDEILLRAGKVSRDHVKQALAKRKENETLGDALLGLGFITRKELTWGRRVQVIGVIRSIDGWTAGGYQIVPDYLPKREEGTQFSLPQILVEVIVTDQDRQKFERALDGGHVVLAKSDDFDEAYRRLGLNEDAQAIVAHIDGVHSASEIASLSGKDAFNVYKLLHALTLLGLAKPQAATHISADDFGFETAGVADAADVWGDSGAAVASAFDEPESVPTMEMAAISAPVVAEELAEEPATDFVQPPEAMPAWGLPEPSAPIAPIAPMPPIEPEPVEEQWGFDEAQIETARRASVPVSAEEDSIVPPNLAERVEKPSRIFGLVVAAIVIAILALGGFAAWKWWEGKNSATETAYVTPAPRPRPRRQPTLPPVTQSTTTAAPTTTPPTSTQLPPTAMVIKPPSAPAPKPVVVKPPAPSASKVTPSTTQVQRNAAGNATIVNTPGSHPTPPTAATRAATPSGDALRAHYDDMAKTFAAQATGAYTVQFELVCETASLTKAVRDGGSSVWFVPIAYRDRACYRVFWGHFVNPDEAKRAAGEIPMSLRSGAKPVVVKIPKP